MNRRISMAFDGIVIAGLVHELNQTILNTKISKISLLNYNKFAIIMYSS